MLDDVVIGGGIAGLTLGYRLVGAGHRVRVLEADARAGGLVHTERRDGVLFERGPETLQTTPEVLALVEDLGLVHRVVGPTQAASDRFVLHGGRLVALPHSLAGLWSTPLLRRREVLRLLREPMVPRRTQAPETVTGFVTRRFGAGAARLVDPFVAGVFAGDPTALEVDSAFADLVDLEQAHGSVLAGAMRGRPIKPPWTPSGGMFTFRSGMQELVDALVDALADDLATDCPALAVRHDGTAWHVDTPTRTIRARRLWMAAPLSAAARLLEAPELTVPRAPVAAVHLVWRTEDARDAGEGFGWLAPSTERTDVLGTIWVSSVFPGHAPGCVVRRVMIGGTRAPHLVDQAAPALVAHAARVIREVEGIDAAPLLTDVAAYPVGIPQYPLGHAATVRAWQDRWPALSFVGWGVTGVGASHGIRAAARAVRDA